jgi:hypothetical protein
MLPNRFVDAGDRAEFNAVDASPWFITAVHDRGERVDGLVLYFPARCHLKRDG